jgi:chitinase
LVDTAAASVPSTSPSLPPWTNAPFTPYNGPRRDKTVIGYYASWQWYDRVKFADPQNIDWSKYDRINYAFFQIDKEGEIFGTDEWADPQLLHGPYIYDEARQIRTGPGANYFCSWDGPSLRNCNYHDTTKGIIELAHRAGATVMPSIGGWTLSDNFPTVAASERTRKNFARNCVKLIEEYSEYIHVVSAHSNTL